VLYFGSSTPKFNNRGGMKRRRPYFRTVPVRKEVLGWHCLDNSPTAKLQAIEVPNSDKFGGSRRLIHCCGCNSGD
jgi:hypothetical protein